MIVKEYYINGNIYYAEVIYQEDQPISKIVLGDI